MSALAELARVGLKARITGGRLQVGPPARMTPEAQAMVARIADQLRAELTRNRAWTMYESDGRRIGTMVRPEGMDYHEALASLPGPGMTIEPLPASQC